MARILVIDDEPLVREMLRETLRRAGHDAEIAADGREGLTLYHSHPADIVITDIFMPEQEGLETIRDLRRDDPHVKVIAISGGSPLRNANVLEWAAASGADYTFQKPVDRHELLRAVEDCLEGKDSSGGVNLRK